MYSTHPKGGKKGEKKRKASRGSLDNNMLVSNTSWKQPERAKQMRKKKGKEEFTLLRMDEISRLSDRLPVAPVESTEEYRTWSFCRKRRCNSSILSSGRVSLIWYQKLRTISAFGRCSNDSVLNAHVLYQTVKKPNIFVFLYKMERQKERGDININFSEMKLIFGKKKEEKESRTRTLWRYLSITFLRV